MTDVPPIKMRLVGRYKLPAGSSREVCAGKVAQIVTEDRGGDLDGEAVFIVGCYYAAQPPEDGSIVMLSVPTVMLYDFVVWTLNEITEGGEELWRSRGTARRRSRCGWRTARSS